MEEGIFYDIPTLTRIEAILIIPPNFDARENKSPSLAAAKNLDSLSVMSSLLVEGVISSPQCDDFLGAIDKLPSRSMTSDVRVNKECQAAKNIRCRWTRGDR